MGTSVLVSSFSRDNTSQGLSSTIDVKGEIMLDISKITHHPTCFMFHPKRIHALEYVSIDVGDGYSVVTCTSCGHFVTDLPPVGDPYWNNIAEPF